MKTSKVQIKTVTGSFSFPFITSMEEGERVESMYFPPPLSTFVNGHKSLYVR